MKKVFFVFAPLVALAATAAAAAPDESPLSRVSVAYDQLSHGRTASALNKLLADRSVRADDPSRLINLGSAYARLGRLSEAATMYRAALQSDMRYDLELADGSMMDSRAAARLALVRLNRRDNAVFASLD